MTIAQQILGKKTCKQQEEPLVPSEKPANIKDVEEGRPVVVTMHAHVRRVSSLTTLCVFATALLVLTTGIMGGMYLYRHFAHYKESMIVAVENVRLRYPRNQSLPDLSSHDFNQTFRHFRGWCSIPYLPDIRQDPKFQASSLKFEATELPDANSPKVNFFEEEFDIDVKFEQYERIEVPAFGHVRRAHFIHDFVANKTGIIDHENRRCFVMVLNRNYVLPPHVLYQIIAKMRAGFFDADTETLRHTMQVVTPPISDTKNVGLFIARECAQWPIYNLEKAGSISVVFKRSVDAVKEPMFIEFAGNKVNEFDIINLNAAIPGDSTVTSS